MGVRRRDLARRVRRLPGDRSGNVIIYVSLIAAVLLGIIGLALDASRAMISKSEAQAAADAAALAAAAQLDGGSDSIARAIAAAQTLIENDQRFAEGADGAKVTIADIRFLETLPASDSTALSDYTTDPADARFVEVVTEGLEHTNLFLVVLGVGRNATVGATAVAGFKSVMCRIPPVFICNPDEVDATSNPTWDPTGWEGRQIRAKAGAGNTSWAPGNFGLLDMFGANGASQIADLIARVDTSNRCFAASGVDTSPGNKVSIRNGLNVRFDIYSGSFNGLKSNPQYRPARNVTIDGGCSGGGGGGPPPGKGGGGGGGGGGTPSSSWFPRDNNISDTNPFGNGVWVTSCASWWATNHTSSPPAGCTSDPATTTVTRYDLYRYEIDTPDMPNRGAPRCYSGGSGTLSDNPDRRIMYMAVVNCRYQDIRGNEESVPTVGFIKGFLTEPMPDMGGGNTETNDEQGVIYLEVIEATQSGPDDDVMRDDVQLYR